MNTTSTGRSSLELDEMEQPKLTTTLNVLTILTFIGCVIQLIASLLAYFGAKQAYEQKDETIRKMNSAEMPDIARKMIGDPAVFEKMVTQQYNNRIPILIVALVSTALCFYGALEMRRLKKQGYTFYLAGQILPFIGMVIFLGTMSFSGIGFYISAAVALLFIILYTTQKDKLVY